MKRMNNKGFTLVELIAIVVLLALVMGIGAFSVTTIIKNAKDRDYELLIENIKSAVELYHQECTYSSDTIDICSGSDVSGWYSVELGNLVKYGFIKGNAVAPDDSMILTNTKNDADLSACQIKYKYQSGMIKIDAVTGGSCPTDDDYDE